MIFRGSSILDKFFEDYDSDIIVPNQIYPPQRNVCLFLHTSLVHFEMVFVHCTSFL